MTLKWKGDQVFNNVMTATRHGIDETTAASVNLAKSTVPVDTSTLQGSIRIEPAKDEGGRVKGRWGSFDVLYALWVEIGTRHNRAQPYLRPSADSEYPKLAGRIKARLK